MSGALDWGRAVALIEQADEVCLACHVSPDGDALGSMLAFALGLRRRGVRCVASFGDPFVVPSILRFLPGQDLLVEPAGYPVDPDIMLTFDAASSERLGSLAPHAEKARELIVLDHHASNTGFGTVHLVDPEAAATAVLAEKLLTRLGVDLTCDIALGLYAGLASDTGSFKFASTTPAVHTLAARLLSAGVRPDAVGRELWDRAPFGYLQVLSAALGQARLEPGAAAGHGLVWTSVPRADRAAHGLPYDLLEGVIDVVRRCDEAEVAIVFKETDEGGWYVSTRSRGAVDVGRACSALGGGGHRLAAAFSTMEEPATSMVRLRELLAASAGRPGQGTVPIGDEVVS
ncbi:MAG: bifunctional oligoribonuclease and phosphatase NrnA [Streptosporangiaceae bacterium]|jgi:phosphoesterase RecJ-like protein|nr:phosphoesterase RecJ domain protein [Streptosporangiaceae bacterium]MDX6430606.1 bifunctional oligoribonuclease and phosphatase NrnA [Streptosporangiaceae bacterium]